MALRKIPTRADRNFATHAKFYEDRPELKRSLLGKHLPKPFLILDAALKNIERGGPGKVSLNCQGGFAYDAAVRKMIEKGLVIMGRDLLKAGRAEEGYYQEAPVSISILTITDKGKAEHTRLAKRLL